PAALPTPPLHDALPICDANPALTGSIVGLKNGDGITASYSTGATTASAVGPYAIVPAAVDSSPATLGNYDVTLVNGTLTVGKATDTKTTRLKCNNSQNA